MKGNGNGAAKNPNEKPKRGNPNIVPGNPGNSGGKKGRSGRKRLPFLERCEGLTDEQVLDAVAEYLGKSGVDPSDPTWRWCAEYVSGYSKSKAPVANKHMGPNGEALQGTQVHVHMGDNGRGISPPSRVANGNGAYS